MTTAFTVTVTAAGTTTVVTQGSVEISNAFGVLVVGPGQTGFIPTNSATYYYVVTAFDAVSESAASAEVSSTTE